MKLVALFSLGWILAAGLAAQTKSSAPSWKLQYSYDKDDARFQIVDFTFPSPKRGIAVGNLSRKTQRNPVPYAIVSADQGKTWSEVKLPALPVSVFFLDDTRGWLVTPDQLWKTEESGRTWSKVKGIDGLTRVYFLDELHGFAIGARKMVLETKDGGEKWTKVEKAAVPPGKEDYSLYTWIHFWSKRTGLIVGQSIPPRRDMARDQPDWMDPETASKRRQIPNMILTLETADAGANWRVQTLPAFGYATRVRVADTSGTGLILFRFNRSFDYPSDVFWLDSAKGGGSTRAFRQADRMVTDVGFLSPKIALLAAIEPATRLHTLPVPGKLKMIWSENRGPWSEMKVDYRASGLNAYLSVADETHAWVALDTGMILKLEP